MTTYLELRQRRKPRKRRLLARFFFWLSDL